MEITPKQVRIIVTTSVATIAAVIAIGGTQIALRKAGPSGYVPDDARPTPSATYNPTALTNRVDAIDYYFKRATSAAIISKEFLAAKQPTLAAISKNEGAGCTSK